MIIAKKRAILGNQIALESHISMQITNCYGLLKPNIEIGKYGTFSSFCLYI